MRIFISGASGNVGTTIVRALQSRKGFELVGGWCLEDGADLGTLAGIAPLGVLATNDLARGLEKASPDLVIDFSATPVMPQNLNVYLEQKRDALIGTTGLTEEELEPYRKAVREKGLRWSVIPNYGIGLAFVMEFIEKIRPYYPYVSIVDRHPARMANAPSGTAAKLAKAARGENGPVESKETYPGVLAAEIEGAQVISQRLSYPSAYSEHEIKLGKLDEVLTVNIQDFSSEVYMDGVFLAAAKLPQMPPGTFARSLSELQ